MITLFGKPEPTLLERLKESVGKTRSQLAARVEDLLAGDRQIDPALLAQLETALLAADLGVRTTREILQAVRDKVERRALADGAQLKTELKNQLLGILSGNGTALPAAANPTRGAESAGTAAPRVIFVVGVNGTGKTTTIGKLAIACAKKVAACCSALRILSAPPRTNSSMSGPGAPAWS